MGVFVALQNQRQRTTSKTTEPTTSDMASKNLWAQHDGWGMRWRTCLLVCAKR